MYSIYPGHWRKQEKKGNNPTNSYHHFWFTSCENTFTFIREKYYNPSKTRNWSSFNCIEIINYLDVHFWWPVMFIPAFCISSINIKDIGFLFYIALSFGNWIYANTRMCITIKLSADLPIHGHCQKVQERSCC